MTGPDLVRLAGLAAVVILLAAACAWLAWCEHLATRARHAPRRWQRARAQTRRVADLLIRGARATFPQVTRRAAAVTRRAVVRHTPSPAPGVTIPPSNVRLVPSTTHEDPLPVAALPPAQDDPGRLFTWSTGEFSRALLEDMLAGVR